MIFAIAVALLLGLAVAHYFASVRRYHVEIPYALVERLTAPDGGVIELRRLPGGDARDRAPVLCVHGIAIDHRNNDMLESLSIARALRAAGRDVWLLTLRSGIENPPRGHARRVRFDAMARHDVPMAVAEVKKRTGADAIDYVGFSMGGMLLYAALGRTIELGSIRRVVIIGSPGKVLAPARVVMWLTRVLPRWMIPGFPLRIASRLVAFVAEYFPTPVHWLVLNRRNVARGVTANALMTIRDIAQPLAADYASFMAEDGLVRFEGQPTLAGLEHVRIPVRFFAGAGDHIAPAEAVRAAFDAWGAGESGIDKAIIVLGKNENGADYGHGDLAIGQNLPRDVFAPAVAFLDAP